MKMALFNLGFRPFFLFGAVFAAISIAIWGEVFSGNINQTFSFSSPLSWHAHEMIFGYGMAIIAGFLLTAVRNWTGVPTISGLPLCLLLLCWLVARVLGFFDTFMLQAIFDNLFLLGLTFAIAIPIIKVKHWKSLGLVSKIVLILLSNLVLYFGAAGYIEDGERIGLYSGLYLIIAIILTLSRRVMPFFIERGVGYPVEVKNRVWLDRASLVLFFCFLIADVSIPNGTVASLLAAMLFVLHAMRLSGWYTPGIWKQSLLWSLFFAYGFLTLGFLLKALAGFTNIPPSLAVHAFTYGGIGIMTVAMMSRVSLGHTGRNIYEPSRALFWMFVIICSGAVIRIIFPIISSSYYMLWIKWSQLHWFAAFAIFIFLYTPKLTSPRVDGMPE